MRKEGEGERLGREGWFVGEKSWEDVLEGL